MFRSQDMSFHQVICPPESIWSTMNFLAHNKNVMLAENPSQKLKKTNELVHYGTSIIKRCEDMLLQLKEIERKMDELKIPVPINTIQPFEFVQEIDRYFTEKSIAGEKQFEEIESHIQHRLDLFNNQTAIQQQILDKRLLAFEEQQATLILEDLMKFDDLPLGTTSLSNTSKDNLPDLDERRIRMSRLSQRFNLLLGTIPTESALKLHKLIFRIAKENVVIRMKALPTIKDKRVYSLSKKRPRTAIFLLFQKTNTNLIFEKIKEVLRLFEFQSIDLNKPQNRSEATLENANILTETEDILNKTSTEITTILHSFCQQSEIPKISYLQFVKVLLEREIQFARNYKFFEKKERFYHLFIWLPSEEEQRFSSSLETFRVDDPNFARPKIIKLTTNDINSLRLKIPTKFTLNSIAEPFQEIINAYGVPRYKEINPVICTIISFPFLFGIMFGDVGHGLCLLVLGLFLLQQNKEYYKAGIVIVLMGSFATYCGLIYNEFFSISLPFLSSCYDLSSRQQISGCVYGFGTDWIWALSKNETAFVNSFKMKFSIIIGVCHMLLGTFLKITNNVHQSNYLDLFFEAIPQFVFMVVTFGYMSFCIMIKWMTDWTGRNPVSIIQIFINFNTVEYPLYATAAIQQAIQRAFIVISIVCIIVLLFVKPIWLGCFPNKKIGAKERKLNDDQHDSEFSLISSVG